MEVREQVGESVPGEEEQAPGPSGRSLASLGSDAGKRKMETVSEVTGWHHVAS